MLLNRSGLGFEGTWVVVEDPDDEPPGHEWWSPDTDDGVVTSAGALVDAINDFESTGEPSAPQVLTLIESFETGTPVPDLL